MIPLSRLLLLAASLLLAGGALWALAFGETQALPTAADRPRWEVRFAKAAPLRR